ncbi:hypothetical protein C5167_000036 [Papaver somniferum]|nr:hypothetical protein C5167_000036 [Papaver somniferum]
MMVNRKICGVLIFAVRTVVYWLVDSGMQLGRIRFFWEERKYTSKDGDDAIMPYAIEGMSERGVQIMDCICDEHVNLASLKVGIWPESESFNEEGLGPVPKRTAIGCWEIFGARFYSTLKEWDFFPSETSLECMVKFSDYFLVAVSPGNRIKVTISTGVIQRNNNQKHCEITETNCPCADLVEAFIKIIEEKADKISFGNMDALHRQRAIYELQSVNYLAQAIDYFTKLGFTYEGKRLDGEAHAVMRWLLSLWDGYASY